MTKKILVLALALCIFLPSIAAYSSGVSVSVTSISGIDVTENTATYDGSNLILDFDITNNSAEEEDYYVIVTATDTEGNKLAGGTLYRQFLRGAVVPFELMTSRIQGGESVNVSVEVKKDITTTYYVSSAGSDSNNGKTPLSAFKTIEKIPQVLSSLNSNSLYQGEDITFIVDEGIYNVSGTVNFEEYSSLGDVTIRGKDNAVISGGQILTGADFSLVTDPATLAMFPENVHGKLYSFDLSKKGISLSQTFRSPYTKTNDPIYTTVYYDGSDAQIARYPNSGYLKADTFTSSSKTNASFTSSAIKNWTNTQEAWVRGWFVYDWSYDNGMVDFSGTTGTFKYWHHGISSSAFSTTNKPWFIYNLPGELDSENEFVFYDDVLYLYPKEEDVKDGSFLTNTVSVNTDKTHIFKFTGSNVTLENLTFENSRSTFINVSGNNVDISGCNFKNGQSAVSITGNNNRVYGCDFYNLGGTAVTISGGDRSTLTPANSVVENCNFEHVGQINRTGSGGVSVSGCGVTVRNNTFKDMPHQAISFSGNENLIEHNDFSQILTDGSTDAGIIYAGRNLSAIGNTVQFNYFHNTNSGMATIYWDDFLSGYIVKNNVFDTVGNGKGTAVFFHAGVANEFSNNIVLNARIGVRIRGKGTMSDGYVKEWNYQKAIDAGQTPYTLTNHLANVPWQGQLWQSKYGHVLKYVDNKTTRIAQDNSSKNNVFINVEDEIHSYDAGQTDSHLIQSGNQTMTEMSAQVKSEYDSIKALSGIYIDGKYRKTL